MDEQEEFNSLERNYFKVMIIKRLIFVLIIFVSALVIYFRLDSDKLSKIPVSLILSGISFFALLILILAKFYFRNKMYRLFDKNLTYREGLLVHRETVIPFSRIQHVEIDEGPLERFFSLATLSVYTAGDSGKDLKINGLKVDEAQNLKEFITNYIKNE